MSIKAQNLENARFGKLTVLSRQARTDKVIYICLCDCGNKTQVQASHLRAGYTTSCGCVRKLKRKILSTKHGLRYHRLYPIWNTMKARCYNPKSDHFVYYGARGISICDRWKNEKGLKNFIDDMFPTFQEGLSIDRIDVNGNYEPANCKWSTASEQAFNKRK